jgi:D-glycero-D-manno-heptose 1,7-bisphosphate phosphatase
VSPLDAVFLDRDGTINVKAPEGSYISSPAQLRLLPHAGEAVRALNDAGIPVLVVTNQQGVASGRMTLADVHHVHQALEDRLRRFGAKLDGFYVCPHARGTCDCRKPAPGLFFQARREHPRIRFDHTVMIGDAETDVQAATAAGVPAIKLTNRSDESAACSLYPDLASAVRALIGSTPNDRTTTSSIKPL